MNNEDREAALASYPHLVTRTSKKSVETEIGDWFCEHECIVFERKPLGPVQNFPPWLITYAFKYEEDATAFRIKFG